MAFDQGTRNRLQRLVGDCRKLLVDEFSLQLQQTYGLDLKTGARETVRTQAADAGGRPQAFRWT